RCEKPVSPDGRGGPICGPASRSQEALRRGQGGGPGRRGRNGSWGVHEHEAARRTSGSGTPLPGVLRTRSDARRGGWRGGPNESPVREISGPQRASEGRSEGPGGQGGGLHLLRAVGSQRASGGTRIRGIHGLLLPRRAHSGRGGEDREGLPVPPGAVRLPLLGLG